jgi:inner membrane protein
MASLGHVAVGMAAARVTGDGRVPSISSMAFWSVVSLLPDIDVIGFAMGVRYGDPWGHRGATHSMVMAVAVGLAIGAIAARLNRPGSRTALVASAVLASHALLDTMTDGGLGCALLWPISLTRYFAPWRPIPVAPIGFGFLSADGAVIALVELGLFLPALVFALWPGRVAAKVMLPAIALWLGAVAVISYSEPTRDAIKGVLLREDTSYAAGFSETAFRTIRPGLTEDEVRGLLGSPYQEWWFYTSLDDRPPDERPAARDGCLIIRLQDDRVVSAYERDRCASRGVIAGHTRLELQQRLGPPLESCWQYSWSPAGTAHRARQVCFTNGTVHLIVRKWAGR